MSKAKNNQMKKHDYEVMFIDSPEYFLVQNAKMFTEGAFVRFICFDEDNYKEDHFYPLTRIHRIKRYAN